MCGRSVGWSAFIYFVCCCQCTAEGGVQHQCQHCGVSGVMGRIHIFVSTLDWVDAQLCEYCGFGCVHISMSTLQSDTYMCEHSWGWGTYMCESCGFGEVHICVSVVCWVSC